MRQSVFIARSIIRRIAHPINFSKPSENGLSWAIHLAQENDAELLLPHVVPPPTPIFELESPTKSEAELALSVLLANLETAAIRARGFLLTGTSSTEHQIVRAARLERVDLIIMGTRTRSGLPRLFATARHPGSSVAPTALYWWFLAAKSAVWRRRKKGVS